MKHVTSREPFRGSSFSALNEAAHDGNTTKMRKLVDNLIAKAIEGGVPAIKEMRRRRRW
jgi:hypothetical protein